MSVHLAKGTRDFLPEQMHRRRWMAEQVRAVFERFGFEPLETPAFERIETLLGKYGDEGDKLIFKILKRGKGSEHGECDQALRYDLTVPLARVVSMNRDLRLPFKRYQIQPVWRADRPQRGRYREFYQCDVDTVGSESPLADAECIAVAAACLQALGFDAFTIRVNDRRVLTSLAAAAGAVDREMSVLIALDKLDKIGRDGVTAELTRMGLTGDGIAALWRRLDVPDDNAGALDALEDGLDERGRAGVSTLRQVLDAALAMGVDPGHVRIDPTLARGLDYYTGPVFEVTLDGVDMGSVAGGGRYDGLIGMFSGRDVPAVGIALGFERLLVVLEELDRFPTTRTSAAVFVTVFDDDTRPAALRVATGLRAAGIGADLYLGSSRLKSQFKHANARGYPWLVVVGPREAEEGRLSLKNLATGDQRTVTLDDAIAAVRSAENRADPGL